ncbi:MAG: alpha amylase C-terminal domain-containing protein [Planctomycetes bacterium]|nr:alpha amylase C-terminal domain-containing protein [Planctomycetota bacterium]
MIIPVTRLQSSVAETRTPTPDGTGLITHDPWLEPYAPALRQRYRRFQELLERINHDESSLTAFASGHERLGFTRGLKDGEPGVWYREWAPGATGMFLVGDFNEWNRYSHLMNRDEHGVFSLFLPDRQYVRTLRHESRVKCHVVTPTADSDRIPAYIRRVVFDADGTNAAGQLWMPPPFRWRHPRPAAPRSPRIYEAHVGMSMEEGRIGTFREFERIVLPRIASAGYNTIQLMAVQEHPYYASFGYHVSNFFAVSSRFGTPDDFKRLVDTAHGLGVRVIMDMVHSHSVKNTVEGLNGFDGTDHQYFHAGARGQHPAWDSLLFDYGKWEVLRFLLSNVKFWLDEYNLDGFRFDGVTSMMYTHHGLGQGFASYDDYLINGIDEDAITYLQLANQVTHAANPQSTVIAEDVSGMVGLCRPVDEGGIGFDYRLAMGIPDYWIKQLREVRDEDRRMEDMFGVLCNRRYMEKHIAYAESHDQALVGDKTIAFWLMDQDMYWNMSKASQSLVIDRGVALHKMIRLVTFALGGEGYLNFMGNEFGHPEWIDFPREGNNWSYHYCRRQWSLADNPDLRYGDMGAFDRAMQKLDEQHNLLASPGAERVLVHEDHKLLAFRRAGLTFVFNWHPTASREGLRIPVWPGHGQRMILNSDDKSFGGHGLVVPDQHYPLAQDDGGPCVRIYLPARTVQVLAPVA